RRRGRELHLLPRNGTGERGLQFLPEAVPVGATARDGVGRGRSDRSHRRRRSPRRFPWGLPYPMLSHGPWSFSSISPTCTSTLTVPNSAACSTSWSRRFAARRTH